MPRKKKVPSLDENESEFSEEQNDQVEIDIEEQKGGSILEQADRLLNQPAAKTLYNRRYKDKKKAREGDFSNVIITVLTLIFVAWDRPSDLKPNEDEIAAFSVPATRMLLRHVPLAAKLSADALDIIGMIGTISAYYVRTREGWGAYNQAREKMREAEQTRIISQQAQEDDPFKFNRDRLSPDEVIHEINPSADIPGRMA